MLRPFLFKCYYILKNSKVLSYYNEFLKTQYLNFEERKKMQEERLRVLLTYAYNNVPYYNRLFKDLNIDPSDIKRIEDLEKLPILTKEVIRKNWEDFIPKNLNKLEYIINRTGGSTGEPFKYRLSTEDYERGIALLYRGWSYAGYELGDKVSIIGGTSLVPDLKFSFKRRLQGNLLNFHYYSSFDMDEKNLIRYIEDLNNWNPDYIRGYASSIYLTAKFIEKNKINLLIKPRAIFTTAEKLAPYMREIIERVFKTKVFDNYGLNDGGVSAYECEAHKGLHVDMERSILEVADDNGKQIFEKDGKILATSLYNFALPFIRYDTGDLGVLSIEKCECGRESYILKEIKGRIQEFTINASGKKIHGEFFTHIFWEVENVKQFQVIQENIGEVVVNIVPDNWNLIDMIDVDRIIYIIKTKGFSKINVRFIEEKDLIYSKAGKHSFVINKISKDEREI